jgi:alpha-amylase
MLWGDGDLVRDPVGSTYPKDKQIQTTVADQIADENSLYNYYCKLIAIRHKHPAIARGTYTALSTSDKNLGGFLVEYEGEKLGIIHNNSASEKTYDLSKCTGLSGYTFEMIADAIGSGQATLEGTTLTVGAYTSVILK